jgi:hypothetical protein
MPRSSSSVAGAAAAGAVLGLDVPLPSATGLAVTRVTPSASQADRRAGEIDDRVDRADLVEVAPSRSTSRARAPPRARAPRSPRARASRTGRRASRARARRTISRYDACAMSWMMIGALVVAARARRRRAPTSDAAPTRAHDELVVEPRPGEVGLELRRDETRVEQSRPRQHVAGNPEKPTHGPPGLAADPRATPAPL